MTKKYDIKSALEAMQKLVLEGDNCMESNSESCDSDNKPISQILKEVTDQHMKTIMKTSRQQKWYGIKQQPLLKVPSEDVHDGKGCTTVTRLRYKRSASIPPNTIQTAATTTPVEDSKVSANDTGNSNISQSSFQAMPSNWKNSIYAHEEFEGDKEEVKVKRGQRVPHSTLQNLPKLRIALTKKEIREDWIKMTGHKLDGNLKRASKLPKGLELCKSLVHPHTITYLREDC